MGIRASTRRLKRPGLGVGNMALVVRAVDVLAVPTRRERHGRANPTSAEACGECLRVCARAGRAAAVVFRPQAAVTQLLLHALLLTQSGIADEHPEAGLKGRDCRLAIVRGDVVNGDTAVGPESDVGELANPTICSVAGAEVQDGRPVVREVFGKGAAGAGRVLDEVVGSRVHAGVQRVSSHDLVDMRRDSDSRVDQRVDSADYWGLETLFSS